MKKPSETLKNILIHLINNTRGRGSTMSQLQLLRKTILWQKKNTIKFVKKIKIKSSHSSNKYKMLIKKRKTVQNKKMLTKMFYITIFLISSIRRKWPCLISISQSNKSGQKDQTASKFVEQNPVLTTIKIITIIGMKIKDKMFRIWINNA